MENKLHIATIDIPYVQEQLASEGFVIIENFFTHDEAASILSAISQTDKSSSSFRKTNDLFAIRRFIKEIPEARTFIFAEKLKDLIVQLFGKDFFVVKSIYFDKPPVSNWFVAYHQDLTITVDSKTAMPGFGPWTVKQNAFSVQAPQEILANNFTIRIHLDDTNGENGALKVIPGSHLQGIRRIENMNMAQETDTSCCVGKGGIMIMRPLLFHASGRTTNHQRRRVVHIEFSNTQLPSPLTWAEFFAFA